MNLTQKAKEILADFLKGIESPASIDATCGNGFDTLFLAQNSGKAGKVFAFDIQKAAVENTRELLQENSLLDRVEIFNAPHEFLKEKIPQEYFGKINAAMFNLGWLPKSDKKIITKPESTIAAIKAVEEIANKRKNLISVLAYPAHGGGRREFEAVKEYLLKFSPKIFADESNAASPALFIFEIR
ncbi:MAG: class I SAM-dependent methyltransferase [Opitutales bacterium]|nr:class I SAM-dependent methyltransferase [Opitutales bacterium]